MTDIGGTNADAGEEAIGGAGRIDEETLLVTLVERIATALDRKPLDLPPLSREIDVEAVATLGTLPGTTISFEVHRCEVFVGSAGDVSVSRLGAE